MGLRAVVLRRLKPQRALIFFVKFPAPGRVKTRLAAEAGAERATEIYRQLVETICARLPREHCAIWVFFDPADRQGDIEQWLQPLLPGDGARFFAQTSGDLGARLTNAFAEVFSAGFEKAVVIGSDCVEVDQTLFNEAFKRLDSHDCVLGPAFDGGYYLLALKALHRELFEKIAWSSDQTLAQTLERARTAKLKVALLPQLRDVDTAEDWKIAERFLSGNEKS